MNNNPSVNDNNPYALQCIQKIDELNNLKTFYGELHNSYVFLLI